MAYPDEATAPTAAMILLVPRDAAGRRVDEVWDTLGMRATRSDSMVLDDCWVSDDALMVRADDIVPFRRDGANWFVGLLHRGLSRRSPSRRTRPSSRRCGGRTPPGFAQSLAYHPDVRRHVAEMSVDLEAARLLTYHSAWLSDTEGPTPATLAAFYRAKYFVGEAVTRITRTAMTLGGAHALFKTSPLERLFRDGAVAPVQFPPRDFCLASLGMLELGLDPARRAAPAEERPPGRRPDHPLMAIRLHDSYARRKDDPRHAPSSRRAPTSPGPRCPYCGVSVSRVIRTPSVLFSPQRHAIVSAPFRPSKWSVMGQSRAVGTLVYPAEAGNAGTRTVRESVPPVLLKPRLLDRVREALRVRHYSRRTEEAYVAWMSALRLDGPPRLTACLLYRAGLRVMECCRLRVQDVDFGTNQIVVRGGKGDKDRTTMLPAMAKADLVGHLSTVRAQSARPSRRVQLGGVAHRPSAEIPARGPPMGVAVAYADRILAVYLHPKCDLNSLQPAMA